MRTLVLQTAVFLVIAGFSVLALRIAHALPPTSRFRAGWLLTGTAFGLYSANALLQSAAAIAAFAAGPGAPLYSWFLIVSPIGNHSRSFLVFGLYLALVLLLLRPRRRGILYALCLLPPAFMLFGAAVGFLEGAFDRVRHYSTTAVLDTAGFIVLAAILFLSMLRDTLDRYLWFALATNGFVSIFGVLFLSAMAWLGVPGSWSPPAWSLQLLRLLFALVMASIAVRRLILARRGIAVQGLLPTAQGEQRTLFA